MSIGKRIRIERERLGHTQEDWASTAGIHRNTQAKYEKDEATPDVNYLTEIDSIGADIAFIRTGERPQYVNEDVRRDKVCALIAEIVEGVEDALFSLGHDLPASKKGQTVATIYRSLEYGVVWGKKREDIKSSIFETVKLLVSK